MPNNFIQTTKTTRLYPTKYIIILCNLPYEKNIALLIAKTLITKNLAACVTIFSNIDSVFSWNDKIEEQKEIQLIIKTHKKLEKDIFKYIKSIHPYQIPELLTLNIINGETNYLKWIDDALNQYTKPIEKK